MGLFVTGEWIKQPRFILNDFGLDYNGFVAPSISWQGYIKIISLKGHASGYINIDVKCKKEDECGLEEWDIHGKVDVNASKTFTWGPLNFVGLIVGAKTGPISGAAINLLIAEASFSKVEHDVVDMIQQKAIPTIRQLKKHGPNVICNFSNFLRD